MFDEYEAELFRGALGHAEETARSYFNNRYNAPRLDMRIPRPQPLGLKAGSATWGRKAWMKGKANNVKLKAATGEKD